MDDKHNKDEHPRASLRGKGREILLGQRSDTELPPEVDESELVVLPEEESDSVDPSALTLTPEETETLLDFSPASPVYETTLTFPAESAEAEPMEEDKDEHPLAAPQPETWSEPEAIGGIADRIPPQESVPPVERDRPADARPQPYHEPPEVTLMVPQEPETWLEPDLLAEGEPAALSTAGDQAETDDHEGGLVVPDGAILEEPMAEGITDPFSPVYRRQASNKLFEISGEPDHDLLSTLVDDARIRRLWNQIEELQERLAEQVHGDRSTTDVYQQELLQASTLLLESRANYDDARAIVYRVLADLNRQHKVDADIRRYRPALLNYYLGWGISLAVLVVLRSLFSGVVEAVGVGNLAALYYPMLLGIAGALISGYLTLDRHTTKVRDFDPIHISWYLFNPLLGGVMGLLMFLLASIANGDLLQQTASDPERAITYLLCVVAGMNQNSVLGQLNDLLRRFGKTGAR